MEKDIDEVGKIAGGVKAKLEAINKEVKICCPYYFFSRIISMFVSFLLKLFVPPELSQQTEAWM